MVGQISLQEYIKTITYTILQVSTLPKSKVERKLVISLEPSVVEEKTSLGSIGIFNIQHWIA